MLVVICRWRGAWLARFGHAEVESWRVGGTGGELPAEWAGFHRRALEELLGAER